MTGDELRCGNRPATPHEQAIIARARQTEADRAAEGLAGVLTTDRLEWQAGPRGGAARTVTLDGDML
jgi:hypothetical protein